MDPTLKGSDQESALRRLVEWVIAADTAEVRTYVEGLRRKRPGIGPDALADRIIRGKSLRNGLVGAATGIPGFLALPLTVPTDVIVSWRIQVFMVLAVARAYGHDEDALDLETDVYLILAGDAAKEAFKRVGIQLGKEITRRAVRRYVSREVAKRLWALLGRRIVIQAGERSLVALTKAAPLVGAPIGFAFDWVAARAVGRAAKRYYGHDGATP